MSSDSDHLHRTGSLYGAFAFGSVIVTCFAGYFFANQRFFHDETSVPIVFALGMVYAVLGVMGASFLDCRKDGIALFYFITQCVICTLMVELSPIRGFFGIIVLPVMSQAVFDLRPRWAFLVGLYLFALNVIP